MRITNSFDISFLPLVKVTFRFYDLIFFITNATTRITAATAINIKLHFMIFSFRSMYFVIFCIALLYPFSFSSCQIFLFY